MSRSARKSREHVREDLKMLENHLSFECAMVIGTSPWNHQKMETEECLLNVPAKLDLPWK